MYFILTLILVATLAYLVYKQTKSEKQWQAELEQYQKTQPRYKIIDGYKPNTQPEPIAQQLELPVDEPAPEAPPAPTFPSNGIAFTLIDDAAEQSTPAAEPESANQPQQPNNVITLEEATRNMLRAAATQAAEQPEILIDHRFHHVELRPAFENTPATDHTTQPENEFQQSPNHPDDEEIQLDFSALHTHRQPETPSHNEIPETTPSEPSSIDHDATPITLVRNPQDEVNRLLETNFIAANQPQPENHPHSELPPPPAHTTPTPKKTSPPPN